MTPTSTKGRHAPSLSFDRALNGFKTGGSLTGNMELLSKNRLVYDTIDSRYLMEDFYAKLSLL